MRPIWRASLESVGSGEQVGFASLADLFAFLDQETGSAAPGLRHQVEEGK